MFMLTRNIVIGHMASLTAINGSSATSRYFQMIMEETLREDLLRKLKRLWERVTGSKQVVAVEPGSSPIQNLQNAVYLTSVNVGEQDFQLVLDTGSSDTWLVSQPFQWLDNLQKPVSAKVCRFSKQYVRSATFVEDPNLRLNTAYADGESYRVLSGTRLCELAVLLLTTQPSVSSHMRTGTAITTRPVFSACHSPA
jgi:hypothetical protein